MSKSSFYEELSLSVVAVVERYRESASDGRVTLSDVWRIAMQGVQEIVQLTQRLPVSGEEKKRAALDAFEEFVDEVISPLDLPYVPSFVEPIVDNAVKQMLMAAAGGLIEAAVSLFNQYGWPRKAELPE